jgi:pimeloyl-ACP methyl ester carboxylesterase
MIERSLAFGDGQGLVGTLCLPKASDGPDVAAGAGIVLFNAGIVHRVGPHRINVTLARKLADMGIPSIRFDLSGLGDSDRAGGEISFEAQAIDDLRTAMNTLSAATGVQRFGLFGFCSGAFHSVNTARADPRVTGLLLFDAYRYGTLKSSLIRLSLRFRQHGVWRTLKRLARKALAGIIAGGRSPQHDTLRSKVAGVGFIGDATPKAEFSRDLRALLDREVHVAMMFAGDGLEVYNYQQQFADALRDRTLADRIPITFLPDIDHVATGIAARAALIAAIMPWARQLASQPSRRANP